jgi:hypothetical protein
MGRMSRPDPPVVHASTARRDRPRKRPLSDQGLPCHLGAATLLTLNGPRLDDKTRDELND